MEGRPDRLEVLQRISVGGQAIVELVSYEVDADEARRFVEQGWPVVQTGRNHRRARVLLVSKRIRGGPGDPSELGEDLEDARGAWARLAREHELLVRLDGVGAPRVPFPGPYEPPGSADHPWSRRVLMAHVAGSSLHVLAGAGVRPGVDQHARMARALAATLVHAAAEGVVHRDVSPGQVLIPALPDGVLDWAHPVLVDFAFGYHPDIPLVDAHGEELRSVSIQDLGCTPGFEPPEWWGFVHEQPATDEELAVMATWDVFGWAQTCAYAAAGEWVFGDRGSRGRRAGDPPYADLMAGLLVDYSETPPRHLDRVPEAMRPAILAGLHPRPEHRTWAHVEALLPPDPDAARLDAAIADAVRAATEVRERELALVVADAQEARRGRNWDRLRSSDARLAPTVDVACASLVDDHLEVFVLDDEGALCHSWWWGSGGGGGGGGGWSRWEPMVAPPLVAVAAGSHDRGHTEVVAIARDGTVRNRWCWTSDTSEPGPDTPSTWYGDWEELAGPLPEPRTPTDIACSSLVDGHLEVFVLDDEGALWHTWWWKEPGWSGWERMEGAPPLTAIAAGSHAHRHQEVIGVALDGTIRHAYNWLADDAELGPATYSTWSPEWEELSGRLPDGRTPVRIACSSSLEGPFDVSLVDDAGDLWCARWAGDRGWSSWERCETSARLVTVASGSSDPSDRRIVAVTSRGEVVIRTMDADDGPTQGKDEETTTDPPRSVWSFDLDEAMELARLGREQAEAEGIPWDPLASLATYLEDGDGGVWAEDDEVDEPYFRVDDWPVFMSLVGVVLVGVIGLVLLLR